MKAIPILFEEKVFGEIQNCSKSAVLTVLMKPFHSVKLFSVS